MANFSPKEHITKISGKDYLAVAWRVVWARTDYPMPEGVLSITTDLLQTEPYPLVKAYVSIDGQVIATAHGSAQVKERSVYAGREVEKAETAAIGRALANAGYGTQFSEMVDDDSEGDLADSPAQPRSKPANGKPAPNAFPNVEAKEKFVAHWNATDNVSEQTLKTILGVEYFRDYPHTLAQANKEVEAWVLANVPFGATK